MGKGLGADLGYNISALLAEAILLLITENLRL
jgi:hypothetical protein